MATLLPETIADEPELEELLSRPSPAAVRAMGELRGDLLLLGVGGKMGPSLARMARRASAEAGVERRVIGVSRFSDPRAEAALREAGVETVPGDLLEPPFVRDLPDAPNVLFMTGMKFGTAERPDLTWAMNTCVPGRVCERFRRSRIGAFSTGNVYPLVDIDSGGSREGDRPRPEGEYAMSALGRERVFEYFSREQGIPTSLIRLNYACELRYGVLVDLARRVAEGEPIDLTMGYVNVIWQADANAMALAALADASTPPFVVNVAGPERLSVRQVCGTLGRLLDRPVELRGREAPTALLSDGSYGHRRYGAPRVDADRLLRWIADWVASGGRTLGKPTHFEVRDGGF